MPRTKQTSVETSTAATAGPNKTIVKPKPATRGRRRKNLEPQDDTRKGLKQIERKKPGKDVPDFSYNPSFFSEEEQDDIIRHLDQVPWQKVTYTKFGKPRSTPRHTYCYGTPASNGVDPVRVSYAGAPYFTEGIPSWLLDIKSKVEKATGYTYNAIILNNYVTEGEYISWHTDDERFLDHTTVASLSFGALRTFKVRTSPLGAICKMKKKPKKDEMEGTEEISVTLLSGSLSVLYNGIEHALPKETPTPFKNMSNRYNITFRCLKPFKEGSKMSGWGNYYHYNRGSAYRLDKDDKNQVKEEEIAAVEKEELGGGDTSSEQSNVSSSESHSDMSSESHSEMSSEGEGEGEKKGKKKPSFKEGP
eukprot:TRINITY_DN2557_c0_g1_i1.p1 TRINITY_DN2557_c0_g1~~TRINITY_DN2557_c0_g1_i1.p1  ORF type:complete len:391 (+),score=111.82 TRINITY_DN2557_c0_g1_i1:89-1174(+)